MWLSKRAFLVGAVALAGCGFTPAYGPKGGAAKLLGAVQPDAPTSRDHFAFTRRIAERLGPASVARYRLSYSIKTDIRAQAITQDNATTRYSLTGRASYDLRDAGSNAVYLSGEVASFTSWSASGTALATQAAEDDARERLMAMLADQIVTRLIASASSLPK